MKKKLHKKLRLSTETLNRLEVGEVTGAASLFRCDAETRGFTNCPYCFTTPADCPTYPI